MREVRIVPESFGTETVCTCGMTDMDGSEYLGDCPTHDAEERS